MPPTRRRTAPLLTALVTLAAALVTPVLAAPAAHADGPGAGTPWVVTLGDSFISGEAGRWAGSSDASSTRADALGPTAYFDNATHTAETIPRCHRSASAEAYIGGGVQGLDLACSGATTSTFTAGDGSFKPGLDFADDGAGHVGQAKMLQTFAASHDVRLVVVSIGGNDFGFGSIVQQCVSDFLASPSWWPDYCSDDASVTAHFSATNVAAVRAAITGGLRNVRTAMRAAGYGDAQWRLLVQDYPSPLPSAGGDRYGQSGYTRQSTGGCGFWDADLTWANSTALATIDSTVRGALADAAIANSGLLELAHTLDGRRLCEKGVGLYEEVGLASWQSAGAVDRTEWVNQIRTVSTVTGPYFVQESLHPNYWAQLGYRSCLRQAWNGGAVRGGTCTRTATGLTSLGEPVMTLQ